MRDTPGEAHPGTAMVKTRARASRVTRLIGRDRELDAVERLLRDGARLVTLLGVGGSGKSRLSIELMDRRVAQGGRAYFVDLVGVPSAESVRIQIAYALGAVESASQDAIGAAAAALRSGPTLLILDNLEELTAAAADIQQLLELSPQSQILATSRIPLRIPGEVQFTVGPLALPRSNDPESVAASASGALFLERARAVGGLDALDPESAQAVADVCRRLDGFPLAIELAAAKTRVLSPISILDRLRDHRQGPRPDQPSGPGSVDEAIDWSISALDRSEAALLVPLAICPSGFDLELATAVAPSTDVVEALGTLVALGLVARRDDLAIAPWFQVLETVRARALAGASPQTIERAWARLTAHIVERVQVVREAHYALDLETFRRLDLLQVTVTTALNWSATNDRAACLAIAAAFAPYWRMRGAYREGIERVSTAVADQAGSPDRSMALIGLSRLHRDLGQIAAAKRAATEATRDAREVGDPDLELEGLSELLTLEDVPRPEDLTRVAELVPRSSHPVARFLGMSTSAFARGMAAGFTAETVADLRKAALAVNGTPYLRFVGMASGDLAQVYVYLEQPIHAFEEAGKALVALRDAGPEILAWVHSLRAASAATLGDRVEAEASLRAALDLADPRQTGISAEILVAACVVFTALGAPLSAARAWGAVLAGPTARVDRDLGERTIRRARRAVDPVAFALAVEEGRASLATDAIGMVRHDLDLLSRTPAERSGRLLHGVLTPREVEVLSLVGRGRSDAEIADALFISTKTASVHVSNAKAKLGLASRLEVAMWARERGLTAHKADAPIEPD